MSHEKYWAKARNGFFANGAVCVGCTFGMYALYQSERRMGYAVGAFMFASLLVVCLVAAWECESIKRGRR